MDHDRQLALLDRIRTHMGAGRGTDTSAETMRVPATAYTDTERLAAERAMLLRQPSLVGLSSLVPDPGTSATTWAGDVPVLVTRADDGQVRAFLNACRHRGAQLADGCAAGRRLVCGYHGWSYTLDGTCAGRRRGEHFDDDDVDLVRLPSREDHGLIWVSGDPTTEIPAEPLCGAEIELAPLDLAGYRRFATTEFDRPLNWKLAVDTFCEAYHLGVLHKNTLAPLIHSDYALFDAFGPHGRLIAARTSIGELDDLPRSEWSLLPYATILWFLVPNAVLIHQQDHVQLYRSRPGTHAGEARLSVDVYVPLDSERPEHYWQKNFDLLVSVTDTEDFSTAAGIQRSLATGLLPDVVFGRNEPALQHFHASLTELL